MAGDMGDFKERMKSLIHKAPKFLASWNPYLLRKELQLAKMNHELQEINWRRTWDANYKSNRALEKEVYVLRRWFPATSVAELDRVNDSLRVK